MKSPAVLDTTLRDGSYTINFAFTAADTTTLAAALEAAGFEWIEVGHGAGLRASITGHGTAAAADEEYMIAAKRGVKRARWGMFCIPGIATLADVDLAGRHRMDFIRIGTNVDEIELSEEFIKKAKRYGMTVAANYMKSYALSPKEFSKRVKLSEKYGADVVYLVDSAGGMLPGTVEHYAREIRKVSDIDLGFHAHNNLGLAMGNTLEAARLGFRFVDSSLQGIGRSSGNACTEMLIGALEKSGFRTGIDFLETLKIGQKYVQPLIAQKGEAPLDVVSGFADFHSSYMPKILRCAAKYKVEPERIIIEACKASRTDVNEAKLDVIGRKLGARAKRRSEFFLGAGLNRYVGNEQEGHVRKAGKA